MPPSLGRAAAQYAQNDTVQKSASASRSRPLSAVTTSPTKSVGHSSVRTTASTRLPTAFNPSSLRTTRASERPLLMPTTSGTSLTPNAQGSLLRTGSPQKARGESRASESGIHAGYQRRTKAFEAKVGMGTPLAKKAEGTPVGKKSEGTPVAKKLEHKTGTDTPLYRKTDAAKPTGAQTSPTKRPAWR